MISLLHWSVTAGNIVSTVLAILFAYVTNKFFVFSSRTSSFSELAAEFVKFIVSRLFTMVLEIGGVYLFVTVLGAGLQDRKRRSHRDRHHPQLRSQQAARFSQQPREESALVRCNTRGVLAVCPHDSVERRMLSRRLHFMRIMRRFGRFTVTFTICSPLFCDVYYDSITIIWDDLYLI